MIIDTLRPAANVATNGWVRRENCSSPQASSDAVWEVLSDDDDETWVQNPAAASPVRVATATHTPTAGFQRHRIRVRAALNGFFVHSFTIEVRNTAGSFTYAALTATTPQEPVCPSTEKVSSWALVPTLSGINPRAFHWLGSSAGGTVRFAEAFIDVDTREQPSFTADVLDASGTSRDAGTISDTNRAELTFDALNYDGLTARSWTLEVVDDLTSLVVFSASGNGQPPSSVISDPLPDGNYTADLQIFSTIRANDAYGSDVEQVTFEISFVPPEAPELAATPTANPPSIEVCWTDPTAPGESLGDTEWDDEDEVVVEIRRTDCNGTATIYVAQEYEACHVDRFMSLSHDGVFCGEEDHDCQICYEARWWGLVNGALVTTEWSDEECLTLDNPTPGEDWLRGATSGDQAICPDRSYGRTRPFGRFQPIGGGKPTVVTGSPGGRDYSLSFPVTSEAELVAVEAILAQPLVFYQPADQADQWQAPDQESIQVVKVRRIRTVSVDFVAVEPQPTADPTSFFD